TIFNILGPISNPAGVKRQLVGVFSRDWLTPIAEVLGKLGSERAWVVHGSDGLDEITLTGPTRVAELVDGEVRSFEVRPKDAGLPERSLDELKGGDAEFNAEAVRALLDGAPGAFRDFVLINSAAALIVAGKAKGLRSGVEMAAAAIDGGQARSVLSLLVEISNRPPLVVEAPVEGATA